MCKHSCMQIRAMSRPDICRVVGSHRGPLLEVPALSDKFDKPEDLTGLSVLAEQDRHMNGRT